MNDIGLWTPPTWWPPGLIIPGMRSVITEVPGLEELKNVNIPGQFEPGSIVTVRMKAGGNNYRLFDAPGVESLFAAPEGTTLIDVYGDSGYGYADLRVDYPDVNGIGFLPAIGAVCSFIGEHWVLILLGVIGTLLITEITGTTHIIGSVASSGIGTYLAAGTLGVGALMLTIGLAD